MTQPNDNWGGQSLCKPTREGTAAGPRAGNSREQLTALNLEPRGGRRRGCLTGANPANLQPPGREEAKNCDLSLLPSPDLSLYLSPRGASHPHRWELEGEEAC